MRVLLVQAYLGGHEPPAYPLGLACIAATVPDHDVKIFDTNISEMPFEALMATIDEFSPDIVGISLRNIDSTNKRVVTFYYDYLTDMLDCIKDRSDAKIIIGGSGYSMFAEEIMDDEPRVDFGVFLEGERILPELIEHIDTPETVRGIYYRNNGQIIFTGKGEHPDIEGLPLPDRSAVDMKSYVHTPDAIGVETKRGCAFSCIYCNYGFLNGTRYRLRDPGKVVDEIEYLVNTMGIESFTFVDSVFNVPLAHAEGICREMIRRGVRVSWSAFFHDTYMTDDFVRLVKQAGCRKIILSPDGLTDKILTTLGKSQTRAAIVRTFNILKNVDGMEIGYNFFKNPPGQTFAAFLDLMLFCIKGKLKLGKRIHFELSSIRVEPHTRMHEIALKEGVIDKEESLLYPKKYSNPPTRYIEKIFDLMLKLKGK